MSLLCAALGLNEIRNHLGSGGNCSACQFGGRYSLSAMRRHSIWFAILLGGAIAGALDISYAIGFSAWRGVAPQRLLQSVASGLLGAPAFQGGWAVAGLGLLLHFCIAFAAAAIFVGLSRSRPALVRWAVPVGVVYGRGLCGHESHCGPAFRVSAEAFVSAGGADHGTARPHVLHRSADRAGGARGGGARSQSLTTRRDASCEDYCGRPSLVRSATTSLAMRGRLPARATSVCPTSERRRLTNSRWKAPLSLKEGAAR